MPDNIISAVDVDEWVAAAREDQDEHSIRRVMRIILLAIADHPLLRSRMVIKGGVLLALKYGTGRHTKDLDFSTPKRIQEENADQILGDLSGCLKGVTRWDEDIFCRVQSHKMQPPSPDASFPTLRIGIGYAFKGSKQFQRMVQGQDSTHKVLIDLSFNELACVASSISLDGHELAAYSLYDQIAEKYRAMIQQTAERRDRVRRQDVYDIYSVIRQGYLASGEDRSILLATMRQKFAARDVPCELEVIEEDEIRLRCLQQYPYLADEIDGELPEFEQVFELVKSFYLALPW